MTPEVILALLSSPLLIAGPAAFLKWKDARHRHRASDAQTSMTRLESENVRLVEQIRDAQRRIVELEQQEDLHREEIHALRDRIAKLRRRMIELGVDEEVANG